MAREAATELRSLLDEVGLAGYPKTTGQARHPRLPAARAAVGRLPGALGGRRRRPRARTSAARPAHRRVVEGGAGRADLRGLQPERAAQDGVRRLVRPARPGAQVSTPFAWDELDEVHPDELTIATVPGGSPSGRPVGRDVRRTPQSLEPLLAMHERDRAAGPARRALAAGLPEDARRAAPRRPEPGPPRRRGAGRGLTCHPPAIAPTTAKGSWPDTDPVGQGRLERSWDRSLPSA
jgi:hypothetical protein